MVVGKNERAERACSCSEVDLKPMGAKARDLRKRSLWEEIDEDWEKRMGQEHGEGGMGMRSKAKCV